MQQSETTGKGDNVIEELAGHRSDWLDRSSNSPKWPCLPVHAQLYHFLGLGKWRAWLSRMRYIRPKSDGAGWWAGREGVSRAEWRARRQGWCSEDRGFALSRRRTCTLTRPFTSTPPRWSQSPNREGFSLGCRHLSFTGGDAVFCFSLCYKEWFLTISISEWIACYFDNCSVGSRSDKFSVFCCSSKSGCT